MERDATKARASSLPPALVPDTAAQQSEQTPAPLGNQDAQRAALQSTSLPENEPVSRLVTVHLDPQLPWLAVAEGEPGDDAVSAELYGGQQSIPIESLSTPAMPMFGIPAARHYVLDPARLREPYHSIYQGLVNTRQTILDMELESDFNQIVEWLDMGEMIYPYIEPKVLAILRKWGLETFRPTPPLNRRILGRSLYLNKLLLKLSNKSKDVGVLATVWTSYYDLMFNHFSNTDELRRIQDEYSIGFVGTEPQEEISFGGVLWDRVKSGEVAENIGGYFLGLKDAAVGFVTGLAHMLEHPIDTLEGLGKLPQTIKTLWDHRSELLDKFVNASEVEKGRYIGRFFGEIEMILATAGGGKAAGGLPKIEIPRFVPVETINFGSTASLSRMVSLERAGTYTVDLAKLGGKAPGLMMMSQALDKTSRGADIAENLRSTEGQGRGAVAEEIAKEEKLAEKPSQIPPEQELQQASPVEQIGKPQPKEGGLSVPLTEKQSQRLKRVAEALKDETKWPDVTPKDRWRLGKVYDKVLDHLISTAVKASGQPAVHYLELNPSSIAKLRAAGGRVLITEGRLAGKGMRFDMLEINFTKGTAELIDIAATSNSAHVAKTLAYKQALQKMLGMAVEAKELLYAGSNGELLETLVEVRVE